MGEKKGSFKLIMIVMVLSLLIAAFWNQIVWLKDAIHSVLDPTAGFLLDWNLTIGMFVVVFIITVITTLIQKYATDQKTLKEMKKEQKEIQEKLKKLDKASKEHQELTIKSLSSMGPMMKLSMRSFAYTGIPLILFFRWFSDYFTAAGNPVLLGFMSWFWFYLVGTLIISSILRKVMDVV